MNKTEIWLLSETCLDVDTPVCAFSDKPKALAAMQELRNYNKHTTKPDWYEKHPIHKYTKFDEVLPTFQSSYFIQRINLIN